MNDFFKEKMPGITPAQITSIALSLAGVNVLPRLFPNVVDKYQPLIPAEVINTSNGNNEKQKPIEQELKELKTNIVDDSPIIEGMVKEWFKNNKLKPDTWLKKHKTKEEYKLFIEIVTSEIYTRKEEQVKEWCGEKLGMGTPVPVTALGDVETLKELNQLCKDADVKLKIDQDATLV